MAVVTVSGCAKWWNTTFKNLDHTARKPQQSFLLHVQNNRVGHLTIRSQEEKKKNVQWFGHSKRNSYLCKRFSRVKKQKGKMPE